MRPYTSEVIEDAIELDFFVLSLTDNSGCTLSMSKCYKKKYVRYNR